MKLYRICRLLILFAVVVYGGSSAQALNCSVVFVSPGFFEFPSVGGTGFVNVNVGPDLGCAYNVFTVGNAIQSIGIVGINGFSFTANSNPGPFSLNGGITVSTGQGSSGVSVTVDPPLAIGLGGLTTAVNPVHGTMDVDYVGGDAHVHQLWYNGAWNKVDLSSLASAPAASLTSGIKTAFNSNAGTMEIHYIGTDQHVYTLFYDGSWHVADLTATTGALNAISGSPLTVLHNPIVNTQEVEYLGTDQHVHLLFYDGSWHTQDLTVTAGAPNAATSSRLASEVNTLANTVEVHYIGTDQHVHTLWYDGTWHTSDLMAASGAPNAVAGSPITAAVNTVANTVEVGYIGGDQHIHQLWYNGLWHTTDLTATTGSPNAVTNSSLVAELNTIANTMEVHYVGTDQHVHTLWYNGLWHTSDLMVASGAPNAVSSSPLTAVVDTIANTIEVEYLGSDQHVHQLWYNGLWHAADLTSLAP
jgi:hypothetical protein